MNAARTHLTTMLVCLAIASWASAVQAQEEILDLDSNLTVEGTKYKLYGIDVQPPDHVSSSRVEIVYGDKYCSDLKNKLARQKPMNNGRDDAQEAGDSMSSLLLQVEQVSRMAWLDVMTIVSEQEKTKCCKKKEKSCCKISGIDEEPTFLFAFPLSAEARTGKSKIDIVAACPM